MNLYQCQKHAEKYGFNSEKFVAFFPGGPKVCTWVDAYFGLFKVEGLEGDFVTVRQINEMLPDLQCESVLEKEADRPQDSLSNSTI